MNRFGKRVSCFMYEGSKSGGFCAVRAVPVYLGRELCPNHINLNVYYRARRALSVQTSPLLHPTGRIRIKRPTLYRSFSEKTRIVEARLSACKAVCAVSANPLTARVLILFRKQIMRQNEQMAKKRLRGTSSLRHPTAVCKRFAARLNALLFLPHAPARFSRCGLPLRQHCLSCVPRCRPPAHGLRCVRAAAPR